MLKSLTNWKYLKLASHYELSHSLLFALWTPKPPNPQPPNPQPPNHRSSIAFDTFHHSNTVRASFLSIRHCWVLCHVVSVYLSVLRSVNCRVVRLSLRSSLREPPRLSFVTREPGFANPSVLCVTGEVTRATGRELAGSERRKPTLTEDSGSFTTTSFFAWMSYTPPRDQCRGWRWTTKLLGSVFRTKDYTVVFLRPLWRTMRWVRKPNHTWVRILMFYLFMYFLFYFCVGSVPARQQVVKEQCGSVWGRHDKFLSNEYYVLNDYYHFVYYCNCNINKHFV